MDSLSQIEERAVESLQTDTWGYTISAGGVRAFDTENSVRLFVIGSASRGIPHKEWEIPAPTDAPWKCCFCPGADVIAFTNLQTGVYVHSLLEARFFELTPML